MKNTMEKREFGRVYEKRCRAGDGFYAAGSVWDDRDTDDKYILCRAGRGSGCGDESSQLCDCGNAGSSRGGAFIWDMFLLVMRGEFSRCFLWEC